MVHVIKLNLSCRFKKYYQEVVEHDLLTRDERAEILKACYNYTLAVGKGFIYERFPELAFVLKCLAWIDPQQRARKHVDIAMVAEKFDNQYFNIPLIVLQFNRYIQSSKF